MGKCVVKNCKSRSQNQKKSSGITFHTMPKNEERRAKWVEIIRLLRRETDWLPSKATVICSKHFRDQDKLGPRRDGGRIYLSYEAVPMLALNHYEDEDLAAENLPGTSSQNENQDSSTIENEIKVFCPKCNTEVSHTAEGMQEDHTKIIIARVYHYLEQEFVELRNMYKDMELTPLSRLRKRTALATGVTEATIYQILKEEEERNAVKMKELPVKTRRKAPKKPKETNIMKDCTNEDNGNIGEQSGSLQEPEIETLIVKIEPADESYELGITSEPTNAEVNEEQEVGAGGDPILINVKTEPRDEETEKIKQRKRIEANDRLKDFRKIVNSTNETPISNKPSTKRRGRKRQRNNDVTTQQQAQGESSTVGAFSSVPNTEDVEHVNENSLLGERRIKIEKMEINEEGFS